MPDHETLKNGLRVAYIAARRGKQPYYKGGAELEKCLDAAAQNCAKLGVSPETYIKALYHKYGGKFDMFYPKQLQGAAALSAVAAYDSNFGKVPVASLWTTQWSSLKRAIDHTKRDVENILLDQATPFTPWFRVIATVAPVPAILKRYGKQAHDTLESDVRVFLETTAPAQLDRIKNYGKYL